MIPLLLASLLSSEPAALKMREWSCETRTHFRICRAGNADAGAIANEAPAALRESMHFIGASEYPHRVYVFVVRGPQDLQRLIQAYANGASHPEEHAVFVVQNRVEELYHELNHEVVTGIWGKSEFWIAEGLAAYATDPMGIDDRCRKTLAERWSLKLADMVRPDWNAAQDPYPARAIYPMLGSFVKYLKTTYGLEAVRKVWTGGSASIPTVFGKRLAVLERDWRARVGASR
jgi:hypothetical protein